ncbi:hypothetical protein ACN38_g7047 [Penicillium nordicum]|uniref:Uncharacterized protein n=1 Tax=Penicillium nordicum TaxID=229535 RepID=A0A0M8P2B0_9EURO|nr:hypothetical protein ACN38_g7047 [Penicillium nordicum]
MQWNLTRIAAMQGAGEDEDSDIDSDSDSVAVESGSRSPIKEARMFPERLIPTSPRGYPSKGTPFFLWEKKKKKKKKRKKEKKGRQSTLERSDQQDASYVKTGHPPRPGSSGTVLDVPEDPTATSLDLYVVLLTKSLSGEANASSLVFLVFP